MHLDFSPKDRYIKIWYPYHYTKLRPASTSELTPYQTLLGITHLGSKDSKYLTPKLVKHTMNKIKKLKKLFILILERICQICQINRPNAITFSILCKE